MGRQIDYIIARQILSEEFGKAEGDFSINKSVNVPQALHKAIKSLFISSTQAYREALLGCALARIIDSNIDIRLPYMNQGDNAFNGRTLDERVVNPFLQDREIPCSKGPYLNVFRRNIRFVPETARGVRDKKAYAAFLDFIGELEKVESEKARDYLRFLFYTFLILRSDSKITLTKIHRLSLEQYEILISRLLEIPSGGLLPVLLSVAMFGTIRKCFNLNWQIKWQGINVADRASGAGGDITLESNGDIVLAVEVTERPIDRSRVVSTFNTKISPQGIDDYLFFFSSGLPDNEARAAARQYFAQGHDISFLPVKDWLVNSLGTIGPSCRGIFTSEFLKLLDSPDVPANLKVAWNDQLKALLS